ncbi:hypothetical protein ACGFY3_46450 [Streptomyces mirabilis]|uniref:hypothetical protein n=1 Tax=Streptomyces mirabilis TaxID=68239 RepID=UPI003720C011
MPVEALHSIGPRQAQVLRDYGVHCVGLLAAVPPATVQRLLGGRARGIDPRPVTPRALPASASVTPPLPHRTRRPATDQPREQRCGSKHHTFPRHTQDGAAVRAALLDLVVTLEQLPGERMCIRLRWDVSRSVGPGGICLFWDRETGWAYDYVGPGYSMPRGPVISLRRVYATPESVAAAADSLVHTRHPPKLTKRSGRRRTRYAPRSTRAVRAEQAKRPAVPRCKAPFGRVLAAPAGPGERTVDESYARLAIVSKIAGQTAPGGTLPVAMTACQSAVAA